MSLETTEAKRSYTLPLDDPRATLAQTGGKGASLAKLAATGFPVPGGFHVTTDAYRAVVAANDLQPVIDAALEMVDASRPASLDEAATRIQRLFAAAEIPPLVANNIVQAYAALPGANPAVAVRSSATAEDLPEASFAGQQETYLNVSSADGLLVAVQKCWASLWTARAIAYRARQNISPDQVALAVVVQLLVAAEAAGILFTANPVTGSRDEILISAAWGLGEAVVGGLVTPDSLIVEKASGAVVTRETADKAIMTVRVDGGTTEQPVPDSLRRVPVLDDASAAALAKLGMQIESLYGMPMDVEWALADGAFAILQARPITALPAPTVAPPAAWTVPDPSGQYMRTSIVDFMPDPLTPLFATMGVPEINRGMQRTMAETIGGSAPLLDNYMTTVNDYAYMYMNLGFRDWLWIVFRMLPAVPRLLRNADRHWREVARPRYAETVSRWRDKSPDALSATELLDGASALTAAMTDFLTALQVDTLGAGAGSEGLFTQVYNRFARQEGDPPAATLLLGADSTPIRAEKALYDLAQWCRQHSDLVTYLLETPSRQLAAEVTGEHQLAGEKGEWQRQMRDYLAEYGHTIYELDFAKPVPADDPLPLLATLKLYLRGQGANPHQRQQMLLERREAVVEATLGRVRGLKRRLLRWTLRLAQSFSQSREDSIFDIGLGYPTLRRLLHELGHRFATAGLIAGAGDIYWLEVDEAQRSAAALDRGAAPGSLIRQVEERKALWHAKKQLAPPHQLPEKGRVMGIKMDAFLPVGSEEQTGDQLTGVAASPGQVTAAACVLLGPEDFEQMRPGAILVAEVTTPAWTPLFAMASGVVTDIGGPLSHGSIVAREYGIPAVLGTGVATQRIHNGQQITVDGTAGEVILALEQGAEREPGIEESRG